MTESDIQQLPNPLSALEPQQMAVLGHYAGVAGLDAGDTRDLVRVIEELSGIAAKQTALTITPHLLGFAVQVHRNTALLIAQRIRALPFTVGHNNCSRAAAMVAEEQPRFVRSGAF
jgi:hypothetical protein